MNDPGTLAAIIVAVLTGGGGLYTALTTKRKIDADSESVSVSTMRTVLEEVREELGRARDELEACHDQRIDVMRRLQAAEKRIAGLEAFIRLNNEIDPGDINGHPV